MLTGALARNAAKPAGAASLDQALAKDHDGSILDKVGDFLGNAGDAPDPAIHQLLVSISRTSPLTTLPSALPVTLSWASTLGRLILRQRPSSTCPSHSPC